jgi:DNA-binding NarL/FixJ family response regulator
MRHFLIGSHWCLNMADRLLNILIGDAQPMIRHGLGLLFEQQPGWRVVGEAEDAQALLDYIRLGCPDLVVLDWELPGMPAMELLGAIRKDCSHLWVVFMSSKDELSEAVLKAGADVFASKGEPPQKLLDLIQGLVEKKAEPTLPIES